MDSNDTGDLLLLLLDDDLFFVETNSNAQSNLAKVESKKTNSKGD